MYNYIFWIIYKRNIENDKPEWLSRNNASGVVFFASAIHIMFLIECLKKFWGIDVYIGFISEYKSISVIAILLCIFLVYRFYTKNRINKICMRYSSKYKGNGWLIAAIIFIPLIIIMILTNKK